MTCQRHVLFTSPDVKSGWIDLNINNTDTKVGVGIGSILVVESKL